MHNKGKKNNDQVLLYAVCLGFLLMTFKPAPVRADNILRAAALHPYGRYAWNKQGDLELISSAVHFGVQFTGTGCKLDLYLTNDQDHNYLQYVLDAVYQQRIRISGSGIRSINITGLKNGKHVIWIYKATEAHTGPVYIRKITADNVSALKPPERPLIEFIGNSITCGAAADASEVPCGAGAYHDQHNAYFAYGPRVARALDVNFILSSVSGIGIYRNWNSLGPVMSAVYEKTDFQDSSSRLWNFRMYKPVVVSIALGTNDFSDGDGQKPRLPFDSAVFVNGYIRFVEMVKSKYPQARIALLSSPMLNGYKRQRLQQCLAAVKSNIDRKYPSGKKLALFFFEPMQPHGCSGHPSVEDHAVLAAELIPFFKRLLKA
jgi:hypothetical protein